MFLNGSCTEMTQTTQQNGISNPCLRFERPGLRGRVLQEWEYLLALREGVRHEDAIAGAPRRWW